MNNLIKVSLRRAKNKYSIIMIFSLIINCILPVFSQTSLHEKSITPSKLQKDFEILESVLKNYHPGLYRYQDSTSIEKHFNTLKNNLNQDLSTTEFYLLLSKFTAKIKCGHTFPSFYNQNVIIQDSIFNLSNKLPVTFQLFERRIIVDKNLTDKKIEKGSEIISINDIPVKTIIDSLLLYVKGDGDNDNKRLKDLEISGFGSFETFDIYFPLLFPPVDSSYVLKIKDNENEIGRQVKVNCISRAERFSLIEQKYGKQPASYDDLWNFQIINNKTAYLQLGTFVTNKLTINWKAFLDKAFKAVRSENVSNLIIDVRGNEGGDDEVNLTLAKHLAYKPIAFPEFKEYLVYEKVADDLKPYLNTWDDSFYDRSKKLVNLNNGFYTWKKGIKKNVIRKSRKAFKGNVYLLVDGANSSATFFLATALQQNKMATIIGTETGGNRKGTNGSNMFFLRLPNSKIEIDIPLIGYYPVVEQPDEGLTPDITVLPSLNDIKNNKDIVLERTLELINKK